MIPMRASVKWLLTVVVVLFGVPLVAQVLPGEEGMLERGGRLPGEVSVEALVDSVARWGRTEREKVIVLAGWFRELKRFARRAKSICRSSLGKRRKAAILSV